MMVAGAFKPRLAKASVPSRSDVCHVSTDLVFSGIGNTFASLHYHFVFSTKHRESWITQEVEQRVWSYLGGIARDDDMKPILIGGMPDHVHMCIGLPPTLAVSKAVQLIKGGSSKWIKDTFPAMRKFAWQDGYGAFSVSKSSLPSLTTYIANQREHHWTRTFQDEFVALLVRHGIDYDKRYLWD